MNILTSYFDVSFHHSILQRDKLGSSLKLLTCVSEYLFQISAWIQTIITEGFLRFSQSLQAFAA